MKYLVVPDDDGQYVNNDGEHFNVIYGGFVRGQRASDFKEFDTLEHALEYYKLTDTNPTEVPAEPTVSKKEIIEPVEISAEEGE